MLQRPDPITADRLGRWLDDHLLSGDARPSRDALEMLAQRINFIAERPGGAHDPVLKKISRHFMLMQAAAEYYRAAYSAYCDYLEFSHSGANLPGYSAADEALADAGVPLVARAPRDMTWQSLLKEAELGRRKLRPEDDPLDSFTEAFIERIACIREVPKRGRPEMPWHDLGQRVAGLIQEAMRSSGYKGRMRKTDEESVTAAVGAAVINHLKPKGLQDDVQPAGFAAAMKRRNRQKAQRD